MSAKRLRPVGHHVLVQPLLAAGLSKGGIHLAETYQQPSGQAVIIARGARVTDDELQPGRTVFYSWITGREVEHEGVKHRLLDEREVLAVATPPQP